MNFESNGVKAIAALVVLNVGLFLSHHHRVLAAAPTPAFQAQIAATRADMCKVRSEAREAAMQARTRARAAQREAMNARRQALQEASRAAVIAPSAALSNSTKNSITDYVRCLLASNKRAVAGGI